MTKEQEAIEYLKESVLIYKNTIPKISKAIEIVLNMIKEKDEKIESLEKTLNTRFIYITGARTVYGRLMQLDKESIVQDDLKCRNELNQCIKAEEKYKELYHKALGDLVKADRENIQLNRQINLMAEQIKIPEPTMKIESFDIKPKTKFGMRYLNKEEVKQYFERKAKDGRN